MKNHNRTLLTGLLGLAPLLVSAPSLAVDATENLCDPTQISQALDAGKIKLNLGSTIDGAKGLLVTSVGNALDHGTAYYTSQLTLREPNKEGSERKFFNYFRMHMDAEGYYGLTAILHNAPTGLDAIGSNGEGLGFGGIPNSVVYEFDNHSDGALGEAHLSLMSGSDFQKHLADAKNLSTADGHILGKNGMFWGKTVDVWIDYDHVRNPRFIISLQVVAPTLGPRTPVDWQAPDNGIDPAVLDLSANVGPEGWIGFTSARGTGPGPTGANTHWVSRWQFSNIGPPCGCGVGCEDPDAVCDPSGICVLPGCTTDADCGNDPLKPRCDANVLDQSTNPPTKGVCVPCVNDVNCGHITDPTRPYCLEQTVPDVNECVECTEDPHCASNICNQNTHRCDECRTDPDCPFATPRCVTSPLPATCDICVEDANCARFTDTPVCGAMGGKNAQECVECNVNADCKDPALPACDTAETNKCVECVTDDECKNPELPVCDTGKKECTKDRFIAGGGCGCSLPGDDATATAAAVAALFAAAAGLSRRRRRS